MSSAGDDRLGGDDFDQVIVDLAIDSLRKQIGRVELSTFHQLVLAEAARHSKIELTSATESIIFLPGFVQGRRGPIDLHFAMNRQMFESASGFLFERARRVLSQALEDASSAHQRPSKVLLVGGTSRIPFIRRMVRELVGLEPISGLDSESGVCERGLQSWSGVLAGTLKDLVVLDVAPASLSVGLKDDVLSI